MINKKNDARKVFLKKGACSHTFFYIINREYDQLRPLEERATDSLAGGIMQMGYQCGMLWGSSMAAGAEAFRRTSGDECKTIAMSIKATQSMMDSYKNLTKTHDCADVTHTDFSNKFQMFKFMIFKAPACFGLAKKWAPDALKAAEEGLKGDFSETSGKCRSCASEVVKRLGGTDEQVAMVSGLAGGLGLSGNACGALSAAIWMNSMDIIKEKPDKYSYPNPNAEKTLENFYKVTDYQILCEKIAGRKFNSIEEHTVYLDTGGCSQIISKLTENI